MAAQNQIEKLLQMSYLERQTLLIKQYRTAATLLITYPNSYDYTKTLQLRDFIELINSAITPTYSEDDEGYMDDSHKKIIALISQLRAALDGSSELMLPEFYQKLLPTCYFLL